MNENKNLFKCDEENVYEHLEKQEYLQRIDLMARNTNEDQEKSNSE